MNFLIKSATIFDIRSPYHKQKKDLLIQNNQFIQIADSIECPADCQEITLPNLSLSSGWFDTSVSFGEPGYEERENLKNGLLVAAKSGFTAVAVNSNTYPVIDNKAMVSFLTNEVKNSATQLYPIASLTQESKGEEIAELYDMKSAGSIAFGDYNKPIANANLLKVALQYAQNFNGLVLSFPYNKSVAKGGVANEGINSTRLGLKGIPNLAEELQISRDLSLLEYTGGKLHIPTISTEKSVALIREAKANNLQVTCSVTPHHLLLNDAILDGFDANTKVLPPVRTETDRLALIEGVKDGTIDIITSDHNPIDIENKKVEFNNAKFGTIGLESFIGTLQTLFDTELLIEKISTNPKKIFGIDDPIIQEGEQVSISLFTNEGEANFDASTILSTSKNTILLNKKTKGKAYGIIANNQLVIE